MSSWNFDVGALKKQVRQLLTIVRFVAAGAVVCTCGGWARGRCAARWSVSPGVGWLQAELEEMETVHEDEDPSADGRSTQHDGATHALSSAHGLSRASSRAADVAVSDAISGALGAARGGAPSPPPAALARSGATGGATLAHLPSWDRLVGDDGLHAEPQGGGRPSVPTPAALLGAMESAWDGGPGGVDAAAPFAHSEGRPSSERHAEHEETQVRLLPVLDVRRRCLRAHFVMRALSSGCHRMAAWRHLAAAAWAMHGLKAGLGVGARRAGRVFQAGLARPAMSG